MAKEIFICRAPRKADNFTHLPNALLQTKELSPECLGILVHLLSRPPNWKVKPEVLAEHYDCSKDRIYRILKDLQTSGYVVRRTLRDGSGISQWRYWVFDEPQPELKNPDIDDRDLLLEFPEEGKSRNGKTRALKKERDSEKERDSRPAKPKKDEPYSEEFETIWKQYPRTKNTSKSKAWGIFRMLNAENQQLVRLAVPQYAEAMRRENRPEDKIKHMQFWLSDRMYETAAAPAPIAANGSTPPAKRFWEHATEKQWANVLLVWSTNWQWSESWGPAPDKPGCHVPQNLLDRFDLKYRGHLFSPEEKAAKRERVNMQLTPDQARA